MFYKRNISFEKIIKNKLNEVIIIAITFYACFFHSIQKSREQIVCLREENSERLYCFVRDSFLSLSLKT